MCWFMVKKLGMIIWQPLVCLQDLFGLVWTCLLAGHIKTGSGFTQGGYCRSMTVHRFFFYFQLQNKRSKRVSWFEHCSLSLRRYLVKVPVGYPLEKAGPILCAGKNDPYPPSCDFDWETSSGTEGITMYSPLSHWSCLGGGKRVGIVGIGGLGQMGVRDAPQYQIVCFFRCASIS